MRPLQRLVHLLQRRPSENEATPHEPGNGSGNHAVAIALERMSGDRVLMTRRDRCGELRSEGRLRNGSNILDRVEVYFCGPEWAAAVSRWLEPGGGCIAGVCATYTFEGTDKPGVLRLAVRYSERHRAVGGGWLRQLSSPLVHVALPRVLYEWGLVQLMGDFNPGTPASVGSEDLWEQQSAR